MSAFLVDKEHIDALVSAGLGGLHCPAYPGDGWIGLRWARGPEETSPDVELREENKDEVGAMLWRENVRSLDARYPDCADSGEYPGPYPTPIWDAYEYARPTRRFSAVEILQAIDCYEYQACEHPGWRSSEAFSFCDALRRRMIGALPGYRDAECWPVRAA